MCFGGRKTREEQKIYLKIRLFDFPETLVIRHATTAARNVVSFSTPTGPFEFERALKLNGRSRSRSNSNGPIRVENETTLRCRMPHHKGLRKAEEANFKAKFSFFTSLPATEAHVFGVKFIGLYGTVIFIAIRDFSC